VDPDIEHRQCERTRTRRSERNASAAAAALEEVRTVAAGDGTLLPSMREALRVGCTIGEICGALRELWGTYDAQHA
jgi:methylmalonyl-CoA mutase N-terminal domain/subunit